MSHRPRPYELIVYLSVSFRNSYSVTLWRLGFKYLPRLFEEWNIRNIFAIYCRCKSLMNKAGTWLTMYLFFFFFSLWTIKVKICGMLLSIFGWESWKNGMYSLDIRYFQLSVDKILFHPPSSKFQSSLTILSELLIEIELECFKECHRQEFTFASNKEEQLLCESITDINGSLFGTSMFGMK